MTQSIVTPDSAGIADVLGFEAAGVACAIREKHDLKRLDLALLLSLRPCTAAGTFTKNAVKAAPVLLCTKHLAHGGPFHGIVANAGNANACTGPDGLADAHTTAQRIAASLNLKPTSFFVCSTGRIGQPLPMPKLLKGLERAVGDKGPRELRVLFAEAVWKACEVLADKIVSDGEKITKVVEVKINGAASAEDAEKVARAIGNSLLVKSSWYGEDPNWGRLADAAGYAGAKLVEAKLDILYNETPAMTAGKPHADLQPLWKEIVEPTPLTLP